jgi:lipoprotein NlpI
MRLISTPLGILCLIATLITSVNAAENKPEKPHPLPAEKRAAYTSQFNTIVTVMTKKITTDPTQVQSYSQRADAYFFLGKFKEAVADYEKMVKLDPKLNASHWRRGIAYFYATQFKQASHQFEIYNSFDNVDRENGIWRFFSQGRAYGIKKARKGLLKYKKDDREPFPDVYRLFSQGITGDAILKKITAAKISDDEREKRFFYAQLYIGLNHALNDRNKLAIKHLREAVKNTWGPKAGYGPHYMWQVGRLHYELLTAKKKSIKTKK